ncbi:Bifunctional purine biosynthesis protein PurH [Mucor velutinosus]|uniref:Bifunctional purine biosynthesis protein PurH n=1 Tax=Mucor velutinosus TaxID=708070 RepID=A0AAN7DJ36_9FUNG|nr:Bifunctional purine biosynthesis protein PurH [Mucor velutinosus]
MIPRNIIKTFNNKLTFAHVSPPSEAPSKTVCFIPGFRSDFTTSKKADYIYEFAIQHKLGFLSWNYSQQGSVVDWYKDGLEIVQKHHVDYIVGASMGLWIALLISRDIPIKGILGIGGGVDFTERWLQQQVPVEHRSDPEYVWRKPSEYDSRGHYDIRIDFLLNSRPALLLNNPQARFKCPSIQLIHGVNDQDVPIDTARQLYKYLSTNGVEKVSYLEVEDGDHRLSKSQDLAHAGQKLQEMVLF